MQIFMPPDLELHAGKLWLPPLVYCSRLLPGGKYISHRGCRCGRHRKPMPRGWS